MVGLGLGQMGGWWGRGLGGVGVRLDGREKGEGIKIR